MTSHENLSRKDDVQLGSDRNFGYVFCVVFGAIGAWQILHGRGWGWSMMAISGGFLAAAILAPRLLAPLNKIWFQFGLLLHRLINPIVMGLLFFGCIMPIGLIMRAMGKRPLNLSFEKDNPSYWTQRNPPGPNGESFKNQF